MRLAVVSDIHGNLTAFRAVLADLRDAAPDLILHGGDLAEGGSSPCEVVDQIRDLKWLGVLGNVEEVLWAPERLDELAARAPALGSLMNCIREMAADAASRLGPGHIAWLKTLPLIHQDSATGMALVHASPANLWRSPLATASDADLESAYASLGAPTVIYGHIHTPFVRRVANFTVANSGSAGMPYDGDPRASYLLLDDGHVTIRRVEYDIEAECRALADSGMPHAAWVAQILRAGKYVPPSPFHAD